MISLTVFDGSDVGGDQSPLGPFRARMRSPGFHDLMIFLRVFDRLAKIPGWPVGSFRGDTYPSSI
jgi:hypothetical protein